MECKKCGKELSAYNPTCPNCNSQRGVGTLFLGIFFCLVVGAYYLENAPNERVDRIAKIPPAPSISAISLDIDDSIDVQNPQLEVDANCVAAYSSARDDARNTNNSELLISLTKMQDGIYLKYPSGTFNSERTTRLAFAHKEKTKQLGSSYLNGVLASCGWINPPTEPEVILECIGSNTNHIFGLKKKSKKIKTYFAWRLNDLYSSVTKYESSIEVKPKSYTWTSFHINDFKGEVYKEGTGKTEFTWRFQNYWDNKDWFEYVLDRETLKFTLTALRDGGKYRSPRESSCKVISSDQMKSKINSIESQILEISLQKKKEKELEELAQMQKNKI